MQQYYIPTLFLIASSSTSTDAFNNIICPAFVKRNSLFVSSSSDNDNEKPNPTTGLLGMGEPIFYHDKYYMSKGEQSPEEKEAHYMAATGLIGKGETLGVPKWLRRVFETSSSDDNNNDDDQKRNDENIIENTNILKNDNFFISENNFVEKIDIMDNDDFIGDDFENNDNLIDNDFIGDDDSVDEKTDNIIIDDNGFIISNNEKTDDIITDDDDLVSEIIENINIMDNDDDSEDKVFTKTEYKIDIDDYFYPQDENNNRGFRP